MLEPCVWVLHVTMFLFIDSLEEGIRTEWDLSPTQLTIMYPSNQLWSFVYCINHLQ